MERQESIGVLKRCWETKWGMPGFVRPKKDRTIHTIEDLRELNKCVVHEVYPLPRIQDILHCRQNYKYFTKINISMQYYTFMLDEESSWYAIIVTPMGKWRRIRVPMGFLGSTDWAQATMEEIYQDVLNDVELYIDDIGIFDTDWSKHIAMIDLVLTCLEENGFTINPLKCEWGVKETDWLGHWLTPTGPKPWRKKIEPILALAPPKSLKQLCALIGFINFYKDYWKKRAHTMAPLTSLTGLKTNKKFCQSWSTPQLKAFNAIKAMIACKILLTYPDPNEPFDIKTDASDYQLGAVIKQHGIPVAFFSRKLTSAQRNYTTIQKELLSIVDVLTTFRPILYGSKIHIWTNHDKLIYTKLSTQQVLRWRLSIKEYGPKFHYKPGIENIEADMLSRYPLLEGENMDEQLFYDALLLESFLNYPEDVD
jgi:hypothetical protein